MMNIDICKKCKERLRFQIRNIQGHFFINDYPFVKTIQIETFKCSCDEKTGIDNAGLKTEYQLTSYGHWFRTKWTDFRLKYLFLWRNKIINSKLKKQEPSLNCSYYVEHLIGDYNK